ncbi:EAL domain-containing protein [Roseomonas sp. GCM10028921]
MSPRPDVPDPSPGLAERLAAALATGAIRPAFQPVMDLRSGAVAGFEVLARWTDDHLGPVPPARFIAVAESAGLIAPLTAHLIRAACTPARAWAGSFRLAFNIAPIHLQDPLMPALFEDSVREAGFPIARTAIELTETAAITDAEAARAGADRLRAQGARLSLDDFGTGHSSLARLQSLPFDEIKVDGGFVQGMERAATGRAIVGAVIGLGRALGVPVVAEGVETAAQAGALVALGCDFGQGWLFGRPLPPEGVPELLRARGEAPWPPPAPAPSPEQQLARLEAAYEAAPAGLLSVDRALRARTASRHGAALLGLELRGLPGRPLAEIDPALAAHARADLDRARLGEPIPPRLLALGMNGRTVLLAARPTRDGNGELLGLSLVLTEVLGAG